MFRRNKGKLAISGRGNLSMIRVVARFDMGSGGKLMNVRVPIAFLSGALLFVASGHLRAQQPTSTATVASAVDARAVVDRYCVTCHNDRTKTAGLSLQTVDLAKVSTNPEHLEKAVRKLRAGVMP